MCHIIFIIILFIIFTKFTWVKPLKDEKSKAVLNVFIEIVNESNRKPNKLRVDQGRKFYNKLMQELLDDNDILMYFTHNEGKSVIAEMFMKVLKVKIYKKLQLMTANFTFLI